MSAAVPDRLAPALALSLLVAMAAEIGAQTTVTGTAQQTSSTAKNATVKPFALPSQITFQNIKDAMDRRTYAIRQVRRTREQVPLPTSGSGLITSGSGSLSVSVKQTNDTRWVGTQESLLHQGVGTNTPERFQLAFLGIEGATLTPFELSQRQAIFTESAGFLFRYQSFRVHDVAQANLNYVIYYLGKAQRIGRPTYRVAVLPKRWDRSAWLLELDLETGYPLYRAEYTLDVVLRAEVEVQTFQPNVRIPNSTSWWSSTKGFTDFASPAIALSQVLTSVSSQVVPGVGELPAGYKLARSQVITDAFQGTKTASLIYSDGIDQIFVQQNPRPESSWSVQTVGDNLYVFENNGITDFYFAHRGVDFRILGGASRAMVENTAKAIYRQAVATWGQ
jgi:hypothetical protein